MAISKGLVIFDLIVQLMACGAFGAGLALAQWLDTGSTTLVVGYTALGIWQSCYTLLGQLTCVITTNSSTNFLIIKALTTAGAGVSVLAMLFTLIYLCNEKCCGTPRSMLTIILIMQIIGLLAAGAGCGVFLGFYMNLAFFKLSYAAYIFFGALGLAFLACVLTLIEICRQREPEVDPTDDIESPPVQREDSDVSVIIHQPYANPYAGYQPPGFFNPATFPTSPYAVPPPMPPLLPMNTPQPPANKLPGGKVATNASERTAEWANQVANQYQQYYSNYYQNYYASQAQQQSPGNTVPIPVAGPQSQQQQIRTLFQQNDPNRGSINVVQLGGDRN